MGEIVNLNKARKARDKQDRTAKAAENRTRFGLTKQDRQKQSDVKERAAKLLDESKLEDSELNALADARDGQPVIHLELDDL